MQNAMLRNVMKKGENDFNDCAKPVGGDST